jgi:DNA polymerase elongation subunit (family B)
MDNNIYYVYYDVNGEKRYSIIKNFKKYYYCCNVDKMFVKESMCKKVYNYYDVDMPYVYEKDFSLSKRFIIDNFYNKVVPYSKLKICVIDIENFYTSNNNSIIATTEINAISVYDFDDDCCYTFVLYSKEYADKENKIYFFTSEKDLLSAFITFIRMKKYDVITGWNITRNSIGEGYDILYIYNRLKLYKMENMLSLFNKVNFYNNNVEIYGVNVVDYMELYKRFTFKTLISYKLDVIANVELGYGKVEYEGSLDDLYKKDIKKFIEYNRRDVKIIKELDDKLQLLLISDEIRRIGRCGKMSDVVYFSRVLDNVFICIMKSLGYVVRSKSYSDDNEEDDESFKGAYNYIKNTAIYKDLYDLDFVSLYPTIMMKFNIAFDSYKESGYSDDDIVVDGVHFSSKKSYVVEFIKFLFSMRKELKNIANNITNEKEKVIYNVKQLVYKILANSIYGFYGYKKSRFFNVNIAKSVTYLGRELIMFSINKIKEMGYDVYMSDTDSMFVDGHITDEDIKKINDEVNKYIEEKYKNVNKDVEFEFKKEMKIKKLFILGKKRYFCYVVEKEGDILDKIIYKGVSIIKSNFSKRLMELIGGIMEYVLKNDVSYNDVVKYIDEVKEKLKSKEYIDDIAWYVSMNKEMNEYKVESAYLKGVKNYERLCAVLGREYSKIKKGFINDLVITIPEDVSFLEFSDKLVIDYNRMFDLIFGADIKGMLNLISGNNKDVLEKYIRNKISRIKDDNLRKEVREKYKLIVGDYDKLLKFKEYIDSI